jgi:hypothetical protein
MGNFSFHNHFTFQNVGVVKSIPQAAQSPSTDSRHCIDLLTSISAPHFGHLAISFANIITPETVFYMWGFKICVKTKQSWL